MKTILCNLTKACRIFTTFTELLYKNMGILLFIKELYARLYHWFMFEALSLLVYQRHPPSKGYSSISLLYIFFTSGASLKVTYSPL